MSRQRDRPNRRNAMNQRHVRRHHNTTNRQRVRRRRRNNMNRQHDRRSRHNTTNPRRDRRRRHNTTNRQRDQRRRRTSQRLRRRSSRKSKRSARRSRPVIETADRFSSINYLGVQASWTPFLIIVWWQRTGRVKDGLDRGLQCGCSCPRCMQLRRCARARVPALHTRLLRDSERAGHFEDRLVAYTF